MNTSNAPQRASDYDPYARSQGIPHYVGGNKSGIAVQTAQYVMAAGGVVTFASLGFRLMANTSYQILAHNHTGSAVPKVANGDRKVDQITVTGPANGDVIDLVVVGRFQGMAGA